VANVIAWASLHLCINFVLFFLEVGKNPLMTANKVRHSPFSYQIFSMQVKAAVQVAMHKDIDFQRKKSKGM
jgi:hypothetical protein